MGLGLRVDHEIKEAVQWMETAAANNDPVDFKGLCFVFCGLCFVVCGFQSQGLGLGFKVQGLGIRDSGFGVKALLKRAQELRNQNAATRNPVPDASTMNPVPKPETLDLKLNSTVLKPEPASTTRSLILQPETRTRNPESSNQFPCPVPEPQPRIPYPIPQFLRPKLRLLHRLHWKRSRAGASREDYWRETPSVLTAYIGV